MTTEQIQAIRDLIYAADRLSWGLDGGGVTPEEHRAYRDARARLGTLPNVELWQGKTGVASVAPKPVVKKRKLSPEGRKRIQEAAKKMWKSRLLNKKKNPGS